MTDEALLTDQETLSGYIGNFIVNTNKSKSQKAKTLSDYEARLELLETYWKEFVNNNKVLTRKRSEFALKPYFKDNIFETTEEAYLNAKGWIRGIIHQIQTSVSSQTAGGASLLPGDTTPQSIQSSYERLPLPRFDGKQRNWETFKQKFVSMIINDKVISPILKLQHLLSCLDDEAA